MVEERKSPNSSSIKGVQHKIKPSNSVRVSFRDDVVFPHDQNKMLDVSSLRSRTSDTSSNSGSNSSYSQSSPSPQKYSKLRSSLIREQMNRDPFFFYQVTKSLGSGSMGEVKLVKKRPNKIGGSARRDIQEAVKRQQREKECLKLPVIGNLFEFCMDGNLKDDLLSENGSSHHSLSSFLSVGSSTHSRSFEDSFLNKISEKNSSESKSTSQIIYAMKSIHLDQVTRKEFVDELRNEIAILKDLDHPNIVRAIETFEWNDKISIVMELCSGGDLYSRDPYKENDAARIIGSVLNAIAYMHSRNIVHRDLKFENVLFVNASPMSDVKLIDFGLSKVYVDNKEFTDISGTIYTMAPEVLMGNHTEKADMWSIGK